MFLHVKECSPLHSNVPKAGDGSKQRFPEQDWRQRALIQCQAMTRVSSAQTSTGFALSNSNKDQISKQKLLTLQKEYQPGRFKVH